MPRRSAVVLITLNTVLLAVLGFALLRDQPAPGWHGTFIEPPMPAQAFKLRSAAGIVDARDLHGGITVLFFGYTSCPDACPLTLAKLARVRAALEPGLARELRVALVSVDPERDTSTRLAAYVARFDSTFIGLTGTRAEIEAVAAAYGIHHAAASPAAASAAPGHAAEHAATSGPALIDHTTHTLVLDRAGRLTLLWDGSITADQMADDLRRLLQR